MKSIIFEVKSVSVSKVASEDKEIKVILLTSDERALELQKYIASDTVKVSIE